MAHHVAERGATNQTWHREGLEVLPHILSLLKAQRHKFVTLKGPGLDWSRSGGICHSILNFEHFYTFLLFHCLKLLDE